MLINAAEHRLSAPHWHAKAGGATRGLRAVRIDKHGQLVAYVKRGGFGRAIGIAATLPTLRRSIGTAMTRRGMIGSRFAASER